MKIAIIGSRTFSARAAVLAYVRSLEPQDIIITGGARGVDTWAEDAARCRRLSRIIYEPAGSLDATREEYVRALFARNRAICVECDRLVAFWDGTSRGTAQTAEYARKIGKPVVVILESGMTIAIPPTVPVEQAVADSIACPKCGGDGRGLTMHGGETECSHCQGSGTR